MATMCKRCKKAPIKIIRSQLCMPCYRYVYNRSTRTTGKNNSVLHYARLIRSRREVEFIKNFFTHKNWYYLPAIFRWKKWRYEPDFYDGARNVFIEVAGTRQAFSANREKYKAFVVGFPYLKFEVRQVDGTEIDIKNDEYARIKWDN